MHALGGLGAGLVQREAQAVFVPGALPDEKIRFHTVGKRGGRSAFGELEQVLEPSPHRIDTPCAHDRPKGCGGCDLLHFEREAAAVEKARGLGRLLELAKLDPSVVRAVRTPGPALGYRNRASFKVTQRGGLAFVARSQGGQRGGRDVVHIDRCVVLDPRLDALRADLDGRLSGFRTADFLLADATGERLCVLEGEVVPNEFKPETFDAKLFLTGKKGELPLRGLPYVEEEVAGVPLRISRESFFQPSRAGAEALVATVREFAGNTPRPFALDLYAGVGLFTLTVLPGAARLVASELSPSSAQDLVHNAARAGVAVSTLRVPAGGVARDLAAVAEIPDLVIADPPRAGLEAEGQEGLVALKAPELILVSCDPRAFAADAAALVAGGYELLAAQPVDQFPGTHHLETVGHFRLR